MSTDELQELFHSELNADLTRFRTFIDSSSIKDIWAFAHKYKVRLHYLGYTDSYGTCLKIERHYKEGEADRLLEQAIILDGQLRQIQNGPGTFETCRS